MGLSEGEIADRRFRSEDAKQDAGLTFASQLLTWRGHVNDEAMRRVRAAGCSDAEIVEVAANVVLHTFANYLNHVAGTELDSLRVSVALDPNL